MMHGRKSIKLHCVGVRLDQNLLLPKFLNCCFLFPVTVIPYINIKHLNLPTKQTIELNRLKIIVRKCLILTTRSVKFTDFTKLWLRSANFKSICS
jgi:hypothetical protein